MAESNQAPNQSRNTSPRNRFKGSKGRGKGKPTARRRVGSPSFIYTSDCHQAAADKTPCERNPDDPGTSTLGKWKCSQCRRTCKVTRSRVQLKQEATWTGEQSVVDSWTDPTEVL